MNASQSNMKPRAVLAAISGNVSEWYDFTVYGFLAPFIAFAFFPEDGSTASLLYAFGVLAVGYAARPLGSVLFGHMGDRIGRIPVLMLSVFLMGGGSLVIGLLPGYSQIGILAPILLIIMRLIQGISVAGEYPAAGVLLVEAAPENAKGLAGSWIVFAMALGCMLGAGVPAIVSSLLTETDMKAWGWRIPFLLGSVVAVTSFILRYHLVETRSEAETVRFPVVVAVVHYWPLILQIITLLLPTAILYFVIFVYAASYLAESGSVTSAQALDISTANLFIIAISALLFGWLSDRIGRARMLFIATLAMMLFAWPLWELMHSGRLPLVFLGQMGFSIINAVGWAVSISLLIEISPAAVRCSVVALGYNTCMALFGGTTPVLVTYLVTRSGDDYMPIYYVLVASVLSQVVILRLPKLKQLVSRSDNTTFLKDASE
ncbi:MFS transporter [Pseudovibrio japonicus]|uniref:MFS transporter n=1 Tax=Pseudovibrio japonicus TaxID=366534 RepID=A0ABQ3DX01_9HYPH|nr:MFS transporter [Pseudovibrio japonicus]GHB19004.1 MFS transporter [Pseudovibrio japonicus]